MPVLIIRPQSKLIVNIRFSPHYVSFGHFFKVTHKIIITDI